MKNCQECRWFDRNDTQTGLCRLVPPVVIPAQISEPIEVRGKTVKTKPFTAWPLVRNTDWCGDYEERKA